MLLCLHSHMHNNQARSQGRSKRSDDPPPQALKGYFSADCSSANILKIIRLWNRINKNRWVGCYIWYSEGGAWAGCGPAQSRPHCTKCNSPPITASVPITVLLYDGPLLCGFKVAIKELSVTNRRACRWRSSSYMGPTMTTTTTTLWRRVHVS